MTGKIDPYNIILAPKQRFSAPAYFLFYGICATAPPLVLGGLALCYLDRLVEDFGIRQKPHSRTMINPHVITMIGGITIIFALGMTVRLVYLPLAKAIKGTVQIDISSTMDLRQNLSIKARLISQKVDYGFRDTEFAGDELILKEGQTYEMRCIFVGPDGRELTGSFPHWRPDGAAGIVHIDPPAGDNVNITALKEGYARIVVEEAGLKAIVECRVAQ